MYFLAICIYSLKKSFYLQKKKRRRVALAWKMQTHYIELLSTNHKLIELVMQTFFRLTEPPVSVMSIKKVSFTETKCMQNVI